MAGGPRANGRWRRANRVVSVAVPDSRANSAAGIVGDDGPAPAAGRRVRVLLPLPLAGVLDYLLPDDAATPEAGTFVRVMLGSRYGRNCAVLSNVSPLIRWPRPARS
jgi:hypothetical protein